MSEPRQFHTRSVGANGWQPDFTTIYPEGPYEYNGAFLGQTFGSGNYYSVNAPSPQTIGNFTSYFNKWDGTNVQYQDPTVAQTGIVFTLSGAIATARYKANLGSSISSATSSNSQRKLVFQVDGGAALLYESAGEIWMSSATTLSGTYGAEYRVSDNTGGFAFPSVAVSVGDFYSVYRRQSGSSYTVLFREKREGVWQAQQQVNTTTITSVITKPVVTRTNAQWNGAGPWSRPRLLFAWQGNSGLKYREVWQISQTNTGWDWSGAEQSLTGANYYNPSVSTAYLDGSMPTVYITYDNGSNVYLRPYTGSLGTQETVPGSLAPIAFGSQVTADTRTAGSHIVNVVWETAQMEDPTSPEMSGIHTVMHQQKADTGWGTASQFQSQNGATSYYRPTITNLSNGKLIMSWDNGTNQYRATNVNGVWTVDSRVQASLRHSNLAAGGTNGPLTTARIVATNTSGPPYRLNLSSVFTEADDGPTIRVEYSRRVELVRSKRSGGKDEPDTLAVLSMDLSEIVLKHADGTQTSVQFIPVNNENPGLDDDNVWRSLATQKILLTSNIDSVVINGSTTAKQVGDLFGTGHDRVELSLALVDGNTGKLITKIGNDKVIQRDSTQKIGLHHKLVGMAGRDVQIVPFVSGLRRGSRDLSYTLVHVHTLIEDTVSEGGKSVQQHTPPEISNGLPATFALHQNYPNPFNPGTQIKFDVPEAGNISLIVFDVLGKKVATVADGYYEAGYHSVNFDAALLASGVYLYRLTAGTHIETRKMVVMR